MRIYKPQNEFGQDLLSTADMVNSTKTITKAIADGKVEITAADLGTDKASDWTVLEVVYEGNKMMTGVTSTDEKITVTLDDAGSSFTGDVTVTLAYEGALNVTEDAQQPVVEKRGEIKGLVEAPTTAFFAGPTTWNCDLPDTTKAHGMFQFCTNLTSFDGDLSSLTDGTSMFDGCTNLSSFTVDLPNLSNGHSMFADCTKLTSWTVDLPKLTKGWHMFRDCSDLTSFTVDLPKLTSGIYMFQNCSNLTSFKSELPALTDGFHMFYGCKLDQTSVDHILSTINDLASQGETGELTLGVASGVDKRTADFKAKGWRVS